MKMIIKTLSSLVWTGLNSKIYSCRYLFIIVALKHCLHFCIFRFGQCWFASHNFWICAKQMRFDCYSRGEDFKLMETLMSTCSLWKSYDLRGHVDYFYRIFGAWHSLFLHRKKQKQKKNLSFCVQGNCGGFLNYLGCVNDDGIYIFWWTNPLKVISS